MLQQKSYFFLELKNYLQLNVLANAINAFCFRFKCAIRWCSSVYTLQLV